MSLNQQANQHRQAILAREHQAALALDAAFKAMWVRLLASLNPADRAALLAAIGRELTGFAQFGAAVTANQMRAAASSGQLDARTLLDAVLPLIQFGYPSIDAQHALQQSLDSGLIVKRFNQMPADAVKRAKATLLMGQSLGWGPRQIASALKYSLRIQLNDALRISRTEAMNAYRAGSLSIYRANSDVVTGWMWLAANGACRICGPMDGSVHPLSEEMMSHPNCRCTMSPITKSYADIIAA